MTSAEALLVWLEGEGIGHFWSGFLVFVRVGAMMTLLPAFGDQAVPARVKLVAALLMAVTVAPAIPERVEITASAILSEALAGLMLGAGFRLFVIALQTAGAMAAQATSLAQIFGGLGGEAQPAFANVLTTAALALALTMGLHVRVAEVLILSHDAIPQGQLPLADDVASWGSRRFLVLLRWPSRWLRHSCSGGWSTMRPSGRLIGRCRP